jgi:hypothetical protein
VRLLRLLLLLLLAVLVLRGCRCRRGCCCWRLGKAQAAAGQQDRCEATGSAVAGGGGRCGNGHRRRQQPR